jgi:hypothetical protein
MNPLFRVDQAYQNGAIPQKTYDLIKDRFHIVTQGISRIQNASGIAYPISYVEPSIVVSSSDPNSYQFGILYARTIPLILDEKKLQVVIQVCAPLVAYGLKGTIHAILAHEFLHYLELVRKISKMDIISDEITGNLFENVYADETRLFEARAVFSDKTLLQHITKKFPAGFRDYKLEDKVLKFWIEKNMPTTNIALDTNIIKLSANSLSKFSFNNDFILRLNELEQKSIKIRKRRRIT